MTYQAPRAYCYTCRSRTSRDHASTKRHRNGLRRRETTGPRGSRGYTPRRATTAAAFDAIRRWDEQYEPNVGPALGTRVEDVVFAQRIPARPAPYTCPICADVDPLCLLVSCEERIRVLDRHERIGS